MIEPKFAVKPEKEDWELFKKETEKILKSYVIQCINLENSIRLAEEKIKEFPKEDPLKLIKKATG